MTADSAEVDAIAEAYPYRFHSFVPVPQRPRNLNGYQSDACVMQILSESSACNQKVHATILIGT